MKLGVRPKIYYFKRLKQKKDTTESNLLFETDNHEINTLAHHLWIFLLLSHLPLYLVQPSDSNTDMLPLYILELSH